MLAETINSFGLNSEFYQHISILAVNIRGAGAVAVVALSTAEDLPLQKISDRFAVEDVIIGITNRLPALLIISAPEIKGATDVAGTTLYALFKFLLNAALIMSESNTTNTMI